ncbi:LytTR family DNA-binding domain-containing protein [Flavihumibacter cheonanensis]|jgi:two-component system LytT family response regulator|uniref:LytR/AlgR family response regulator transcription factor n=1 Tax=Flavihumibacter cheonanensis TaxID=1442385 RepID=UPI001EF7A8E9|nr:LytTR family DNA-binding domain-containing protein [Flavihumibacter cheonanensis]MCG7752798.1 LytTR family DNA-binding domain-containing protein [Flavihumibacter cheonanensis]
MKVLIIDDEVAARQLIREYLEDFPSLQIAGECQQGLEAVAAIDNLEPDLVFLDIQMPGLSGFQVLQQIVHIPQIIFSTAFDKYALKAFEHNAVDYLLKPYSRERFHQAVHKLLHPMNRNREQVKQLTEQLQQGKPFPERLLVEQGNRLVGLQVSDIIWIEADGDYSRIYAGKQQYLSNLGISQLEQKLNPAVFQRIHRSAMINIHEVKEVRKEPSGMQVVLSNGLIQKVSRSYTEALKKWMI